MVWRLDRLGRITHQLVNLLEQFERDRTLLRERIKAGLAAARARGRLGGRKPRPSADELDTARRLTADPLFTMEEIASRLRVGHTILYRALARARALPIDNDAAAAKAAGKARAPGRKPRIPVREPAQVQG